MTPLLFALLLAQQLPQVDTSTVLILRESRGDTTFVTELVEILRGGVGG